MIGIELSVFGLILGGYALWVLGMYGAALVRSFAWRKRERLSQELLPLIREALVDYLAGSDDTTKIRGLVKESRRDVGDVLLAFQGTVGGAARDRLCDLALGQALVHDWCREAQASDLVTRRVGFERLAFVCSYEPCRRVAGDLLIRALEDEDSEVRFSAARALLQSGGPDEIERVFTTALGGDLLVRILLSEELRRHAPLLCERAIPSVIAAEQHSPLLSLLEMLVAWERALPLTNLHTIVNHPVREIRLEALRLTPLVPLTTDTRGAILDSLGEADPEFAVAGCNCAARLHLEEALPGLARCLRRGPASVAQAAATALAAMPPRGWTTLGELAASDNPAISTPAREALERAGMQGPGAEGPGAGGGVWGRGF